MEALTKKGDIKVKLGVLQNSRWLYTPKVASVLGDTIVITLNDKENITKTVIPTLNNFHIKKKQYRLLIYLDKACAVLITHPKVYN